MPPEPDIPESKPSGVINLKALRAQAEELISPKVAAEAKQRHEASLRAAKAAAEARAVPAAVLQRQADRTPLNPRDPTATQAIIHLDGPQKSA